MTDLNTLSRKIGSGNAERGFHAQSQFLRGQMSAAESPAELAGAEGNLANCAVVKLALVAGEALEGVEEIRNGHGLDEIYYSGGMDYGRGLQPTSPIDDDGELRKPEGAVIEGIDVIVRQLDWFAEFAPDIDIDDALRQKLAYNATRGIRHGGKRF